PRPYLSSGHSGSVPAAGEYGPHLGPQGKAVLPLVLREPLQPGWLAQPSQVRLALPQRQHFLRDITVYAETAVECLGQHNQVGPQPFERLPPPVRLLRRAELGRILAESAAG